ncbi:MAG TPA: flagellar hook-basal body protein [Candidatus Baltobacteraceae bacterium]|nr:flagellar hook-basal body protein [Candidatus Baltobacteraceae bacterium]
MDRALFAAATGMAAQQQNLDVLSNNLANSEVAGFKESSQTFAVLAAPGAPGLGTIATGEQTLFKQGKLEKSNGPFDVAIDGPGFFALRDARGRRAYTRNGEFARASDGTLRTADGWRLENAGIPPDALSARVTEDGVLTVTTSNGAKRLAQLRIAIFPAPEHLRAAGSTIFTATHDSGPAKMIVPGGDDGPKIRFGMLERSNVSIIESMMQILAAQRAYEANAKGVQAADEMLRIANNLQRT